MIPNIIMIQDNTKATLQSNKWCDAVHTCRFETSPQNVVKGKTGASWSESPINPGVGKKSSIETPWHCRNKAKMDTSSKNRKDLILFALPTATPSYNSQESGIQGESALLYMLCIGLTDQLYVYIAIIYTIQPQFSSTHVCLHVAVSGMFYTVWHQ